MHSSETRKTDVAIALVCCVSSTETSVPASVFDTCNCQVSDTWETQMSLNKSRRLELAGVFVLGGLEPPPNPRTYSLCRHRLKFIAEATGWAAPRRSLVPSSMLKS